MNMLKELFILGEKPLAPKLIKLMYYPLLFGAIIFSILCIVEGFADPYGLGLVIIGALGIIIIPMTIRLITDVLLALFRIYDKMKD